jgi:hypothetical protein
MYNIRQMMMRQILITLKYSLYFPLQPIETRNPLCYVESIKGSEVLRILNFIPIHYINYS